MNSYRVIVGLTNNPGYPIVVDHITDNDLKTFTETRESGKLFAKLGNQLIKARLIKEVDVIPKAMKNE